MWKLFITMTCFSFFNTAAYSQIKDSNKLSDVAILSDIELKEIVDLVGTKSIVGLGEGTHGTREFNQVRSAISRKLIEERGFNYICLENSYGEVYALNKKLVSGNGVNETIKNHLLGIYQTEEVSLFLSWLQKHNTNKKDHEITLTGIDFFELGKTYDLFLNTLANTKDNLAFKLIREEITFQDSIHNYQLTRDERFVKSINRCYVMLDSLNRNQKLKYADTISFSKHYEALMIKFKMYHDASLFPKGPVLNRDSAMAKLVTNIKQADSSAKILVWAHNLHISKKYLNGKGKNGGGMGEYIERIFPNEYLAIATTTSTGTYSVTKEKYPTRFNKFISVDYPKNPERSLGRILDKRAPHVVLNLKQTDSLPAKVIYLNPGYNYSPGLTPTFDIVIKDHFDILIHIPRTTASAHL